MPFTEPKYKNAQLLQNAIDEYFNLLKEEKATPTISGLAFALGFVSRQSIYDYEKLEDERSYTIKRAVLRIESYHEEGLSKQSNSGHIFWLKNRDWKDKSEHEYSGEVKTGNITLEYKGKEINLKDDI
jgi:hypothetical protein